MERVHFEHVEAERCTGCSGLWLGRRQREELLALPGAEAIDCGPTPSGRTRYKLDRRPCPKCGGGQLVRRPAGEGAAVSHEHCAVCGGSFFDAGEFRKLKEPSLWERVLGLKRRGVGLTSDFADAPWTIREANV
jgi:Zn-finger nucleic acid-binding protein